MILWRSAILVSLATLAASASAATLEGTVVGTDGVPIGLANVILLGTKDGALTDAKGRFRIAGVSPGQYQLRVLGMGYEPVTQVITVDSVVVQHIKLRLNEPGHKPLAPFKPIPEDLVKALGKVDSGQSFLIDPRNPKPMYGPTAELDGSRIGPYPILRRGPDLSREDASRLAHLLRDEKSYWHPVVGEKKMCEVTYRHGLRLFGKHGDVIECAFCLTCGQVAMTLNEGAASWGADFQPIDKQVAHVFQQAFPDSSRGK
jgi:hypothetical protein